MKNTKQIISGAMIVIGSFLEVYYYQFRFATDGIPIWLGILIGFGLNLLLLLLVYWNKNILLIVLLICYSVISTSAGQTFSLIEKQKSDIEQKISPEKTRILDEIKLLTEERTAINKQIGGTVETLEDRYEWSNTLGKAEERKKEIEIQLKAYNEKVEKLTDGITIAENNVYTFYADLLQGTVHKDFLKFIFHTILSIFIALMAPTGIKIFTLKDSSIILYKKADTMDFKVWIEMAWYGEKRGRTKIPNVTVIQEYFQIRGIPFDMAKHNEYQAKAIENGWIDSAGNILVGLEKIKEQMK